MGSSSFLGMRKPFFAAGGGCCCYCFCFCCSLLLLLLLTHDGQHVVLAADNNPQQQHVQADAAADYSCDSDSEYYKDAGNCMEECQDDEDCEEYVDDYGYEYDDDDDTDYDDEDTTDTDDDSTFTAWPILDPHDEAIYNITDNMSFRDFYWATFFYNVANGFITANVIGKTLFECHAYEEETGVQTDDNDVGDSTIHSTADDTVPVENTDGIGEGPSKAYSTIPTEDDWKLFEEAYYWATGIVDRGTTTTTASAAQEQRRRRLPPSGVSKPNALAFPSGSRGISVPFEVWYDPSRPELGRGLYATSFVPKGTPIWSGSYTASFTVHDHHPTTTSNGRTTNTTTTTKNNTTVNKDNNENQNETETPTFFTIPTYRRFIEYLFHHYLLGDGTTTPTSYYENFEHEEQKECIADDDYEKLTTTTTTKTTAKTTRTGTTRHNWACDALMWTYISYRSDLNAADKKIPAVCISFDHGSMFNNAMGNETLMNVGEISHPKNSTGPSGPRSPFHLPGLQFVPCQFEDLSALKDIQKGEELRYNYGYEFEELN